MARLIDADALVKHTKDVYCYGCNHYNYIKCRSCGTGDAIYAIENADTVDAIPISWLKENALSTNNPFSPYMMVMFQWFKEVQHEEVHI